MRAFNFLMLAAFCLSLGLAAPADAGEGHTNRKVAREAVVQAMEQPVSLDSIDTPLVDITNYLSDALGVSIHLDLPGLEECNVSADQAISFTEDELPASDALTLILQPLGLAWAPQHGVIWISSQDVIDRTLYIQVYDVTDLLESAFESEAAKALGIIPLNQMIMATIAPDSWKRSSDAGTLSLLATSSKGILVVNQSHAVHEQIKQLLEDVRSIAAAD